MSAPDQSVSPNAVFPVCAEIPEYVAMKQKLSETGSQENWEVFDRSRKKKCFFKRFRQADAQTLSSIQTNIAHWVQLRANQPEMPDVILLGQDADGIWFIRDAVPGQSIAEQVRPDKPMKEHEAARHMLALCHFLAKWHAAGFFHCNLKPNNIFTQGLDQVIAVDPDFTIVQSAALKERDVSALTRLLVFCLTGQAESPLEHVPETFRPVISAQASTFTEFQTALEQLVRTTRQSSFNSSVITSPSSTLPDASSNSALSSVTPQAVIPDQPPAGAACPQCHTPLRPAADRTCPQCGRPYYEPCLNCQSLNPFWVRNCRGCSSDLLTLKQQLFANLNSQKQQILKYRESYGHDKTPPLLKYMSTVNHPDFVAFKEWAKSMTMLIQKERRDIKAYVEGIRAQANAAMESQKYDRVRQILEQVPRPLLDEQLRQQYIDAGDALTEVDSLIKEIRNAISTKQYSQLLSCVQRYAELKANDPEAQNLQRKIEKLTTITTSNGMKLRRLPGGRFYMGSHDTDEYLRNNEHPQHKVVISHNLFIGVYLVTQKEFQELMEFNPSLVTDNENCPAESVTWYSAIEFCNKMSEAESLAPYYSIKAIRRRTNGSIEGAKVSIQGGDGYRLPTEAEWEYACRAGSVSPWCFGDLVLDVGAYAWYYDNSSMETHPVGLRKPNAWGLYDMHGNVMEWCFDWYNELQYSQASEEETNPTGPEEGTAKVLRGGAWQFGAEATRCAYRNSSVPESVAGVIGFRICRNADEAAM